jgi:hypothetical protein
MANIEFQLSRVNEEAAAVQENFYGIKRSTEQLDDVARSAESSLSSFLDALVDRGGRAKGAIEGLVRSLAKLLLQQQTAPFLQNIASSFAGAFANVFSTGVAADVAIGTNAANPPVMDDIVQGYVQSLPRYGDGATVFKPHVAVVGDKGPERITPLAQERAAPIVNQYISTTDADSFRRSSRHIARDARRYFGR